VAQSGSAEPTGFSRAFANMVQSDDDLVGLLAYALYKRGIREEAERGGAPNGGNRNPPPTVVEAYRNAAEQKLAVAIEAAVEEARPGLQSSAFTDAVEKTRSDLRDHITERTDFKSALTVNIIAWIVTLAATALIIWLVGKPDLPTALLEKPPTAQQGSLPAPSSDVAPEETVK
jgi:hypothetical protein